MSRGFGHVQDTLVAILRRHPEGSFSTVDLCDQVFGYDCIHDKAKRLSVIRAMKSLLKWQFRDWTWLEVEHRGGELLFFNHASVTSYALARIRKDGWRKIQSDADARGQLERHADAMAPGGIWWLFVEQWVAERDRTTKRLAELKPYWEESQRKLD
jgi:hypothetical protein